MSDLFFQARNFISKRSDLPHIQNSKDIYISTKLEADAYGHWIFTGDNPLVDKINNKNLMLQMGATIQPIFTDQGVALTNANGSALISDLVDSANTNITAIFVAKTTNNSLYLLGMTLPTTNSTTENGFGAYLSNDKAYLNLKPNIANSTGSISGITTNQSISQTTHCLVALSVNKATKTAILYTMKDGIDTFISTTFAPNYADSTKKLTIGNAYYSVGEFGLKSTFAEAILYNKALTLNEIKSVANRCRARLQHKNIII